MNLTKTTIKRRHYGYFASEQSNWTHGWNRNNYSSASFSSFHRNDSPNLYRRRQILKWTSFLRTIAFSGFLEIKNYSHSTKPDHRTDKQQHNCRKEFFIQTDTTRQLQTRDQRIDTKSTPLADFNTCHPTILPQHGWTRKTTPIKIGKNVRILHDMTQRGLDQLDGSQQTIQQMMNRPAFTPSKQ